MGYLESVFLGDEIAVTRGRSGFILSGNGSARNKFWWRNGGV